MVFLSVIHYSPHKVQETKRVKMADFWPLFSPLPHSRQYSSQKVAMPVHSYGGLPLPPVRSCGHYCNTIRDKVPQSILSLFSTEEDSEKLVVVKDKTIVACAAYKSCCYPSLIPEISNCRLLTLHLQY